MAITTRTLITSPAAAAVAAWTVLGLSLFASQFDFSTPEPLTTSCSHVADANGPDVTTWAPLNWYSYAQCIHESGDTVRAAGIARLATLHHPTNEGLVNYAGILLIKVQDYEAAVKVLSDGTKRIRPTDGTLYNNLVWASLYTGAHHTDILRRWNQASLKMNPNSCEQLHTGLMVEWRRATEARSGFALNDAVNSFMGIYDRYESCTERSSNDETSYLAERLTALVAVSEVDALMGVSYNSETRRELTALAPALQNADSSVTAHTLCHEIPSTLNSASCFKTVQTLMSGNPL